MSEFIIYGKDNCQYCESAKALLTQKGHEFKYLTMGVDYTREELLDLVPDAKTVPQIWAVVPFGNDMFSSHLGGYAQLESYLCETSEIDVDLARGYTIAVTFTKADGTERRMLCTKNNDLIAERFIASEKKTDRPVKDNPAVCKVFDLEKNEWRSFRYDSVISYELAEEI